MQVSKKRILLIIPYYGRWPRYFGFYLQSLAERCFDLLLVTDLSLSEYRVPGNVKVVNLPFVSLRELFERKLGTDVILESPIRLCDFKPMYGKVFEDYLDGYDYWAFGDCDLVYGNAFDPYLQRRLEEGFDALSLHPIWPTGSFFTVRNCEKMNRFYERTNNWKEICRLRGMTFVNYDEVGGGFYRKLESGGMTLEDCAEIRDSFGAALARTKDIKYIRDGVHAETALVGEVVEMDHGRLTLDGREIPIFHFVNCKGRRYFNCPVVTGRGCERYHITRTGFYCGALQWRLHVLIGLWRQVVAACGSLRANGFRRLANRRSI